MLAAVSPVVITGIVDLVKTLFAGHKELEGELADLLIEDLEHLSRHRDMDFVNKVFIPLIKVEKNFTIDTRSCQESHRLKPARFTAGYIVSCGAR